MKVGEVEVTGSSVKWEGKEVGDECLTICVDPWIFQYKWDWACGGWA